MLIRLLRSAFSRQSPLPPAGPMSFRDLVTGVIHVGAHVGDERELYDEAGVGVVWVEPIPELYARLRENIRPYPRQRAVCHLVTDRDGAEYEFHVANNDGRSSSIFDLAQHRDIWPGVDFERTIRLTSLTLQTLVKREGIDLDDYPGLVLDTQGSELLVLKGAGELLRRFRFIQAEAADFESYAGGCRLSEIDSYLGRFGFRERSRDCFAQRAEGGHYYDVLYERNV